MKPGSAITDQDTMVISGAPLIGEGNIIDSKAVIARLARCNIPVRGFYPNGPFVHLARMFHIRMTMSMANTMEYTKKSTEKRSSLFVSPLRWELRRAIARQHKLYPDAGCFITSQDMMAEESVGRIGNASTIMISSDVNGKFSHQSKLSPKHKQIHYLLWNREAVDFFKGELKLENTHHIEPLDPIEACDTSNQKVLPFYEELEEPNLCFIKLSGSGGAPALVSAAITSLLQKSGTRCIVFPGTEKTLRSLEYNLGDNNHIKMSLDPSRYYIHTRHMISHNHMLLTYPSEQVKHIAILTQQGVYPKIAWLPPRGNHELLNLCWAIKKNFSATVCIPRAYQNQLRGRLIDTAVNPAAVELIDPAELTAEHFKPSPQWQPDFRGERIEKVVKQIAWST